MNATVGSEISPSTGVAGSDSFVLGRRLPQTLCQRITPRSESISFSESASDSLSLSQSVSLSESHVS